MKHKISIRFFDDREVRAVWDEEHAMKTVLNYLDCSESIRRQRLDVEFDEVRALVDKKSVPYFRIILRKNFNWFAIFADNRHIEDVVEIVIRGIDVGRRELFIYCYLKK